LDSLPIKLKMNLNKLAISGTSGTLTASNLKGEPIGEAIPYDQPCNEHKILLESLTSEEEHLRTPYSSLAKALKLIDKYGTNILLRHQSDWITGCFLKDWTYGEEGNNLKLGWDLKKDSWPNSYLNTSWQKCLPEIIKSGKIKIIDILQKKAVEVDHNLNFLEHGQGGLLDILYKDNFIYVSYSENRGEGKTSTSIAKGKFDKKKIIFKKKIFFLSSDISAPDDS